MSIQNAPVPEAANSYEQELKTGIFDLRQRIVVQNFVSALENGGLALPLNEDNIWKLPQVLIIENNELYGKNEMIGIRESLSIAPNGEWLCEAGAYLWDPGEAVYDGVLATYAIITELDVQKIDNEYWDNPVRQSSVNTDDLWNEKEEKILTYVDRNRIRLLEGLKKSMEEAYTKMISASQS